MRKSIILLLLVGVGLEYGIYFYLVPPRPSFESRIDGLPATDAIGNVLGQPEPWPSVYGLILIVLSYGTKTWIVLQYEDLMSIIILYASLVALCFPLLWVFVSTDWSNPHAEEAYWCTLPVGLLAVPTIGLAYDLGRRPYRHIGVYSLKTCIELVLIPAWLYAWVWIELVLGLWWI